MAGKTELEKLQEENDNLKKENAQLKKDHAEATKIAKDAVDKYNELAPQAKADLKCKTKDGDFKINFGVNLEGTYFSKEDLSKNPDVVLKLAKKGSGAVTKL